MLRLGVVARRLLAGGHRAQEEQRVIAARRPDRSEPAREEPICRHRRRDRGAIARRATRVRSFDCAARRGPAAARVPARLLASSTPHSSNVSRTTATQKARPSPIESELRRSPVASSMPRTLAYTIGSRVFGSRARRREHHHPAYEIAAGVAAQHHHVQVGSIVDDEDRRGELDRHDVRIEAGQVRKHLLHGWRDLVGFRRGSVRPRWILLRLAGRDGSSGICGNLPANRYLRRNAALVIHGAIHPLSASLSTLTPGATSASIASSVAAIEPDVGDASRSSSCSIVRGPMIVDVTAGCSWLKAIARCVRDSPASRRRR